MTLNYSYRSIFKVTLPIMFGTFVQFIVVFTDNSFLGHLNENAFNAAGNAGLIYLSLFMLLVGFSSGSQILIARRNSEGKNKMIGLIFNHSLWLLIIFGLLLFLLIYTLSPVLIPPLLSSAEISKTMISFLEIRSFGMLFTALNLIIAAFYMGIAKTSILAYTTVITGITNIFLDYALIFGNFGFPRLEADGAAIATVIAELAALLFSIAYVLYRKDHLRYYLLHKPRKIYFRLIKRISIISWPLMIQGFLSLAAWTTFFLLLEKLGERELTISHIVRNLYMLALISIMGFSSSTKTFVSSLMAERKFPELRILLKRIILLSVLVTLVMVHGLVFYPEWLISLFTNNPQVIAETKPVLLVIIGNMLLFGISSVLFNAVAGSGNTATAMRIELFSIIIYLGGTYYLTVISPSDLLVVWAMEYIYFGILATLSYIYLRQGKWKLIKI